MRLAESEARRRFPGSPIAHLATVRPDGAPHLVPVAFAVDGDVVFTAVDDKPKGATRLQRLVNLEHEARCALLVDRYDDDWSQLWWVRADGRAEVVDPAPADHPGLLRLRGRYPQYQQVPLRGPLVVVTVTRWTGWSASVAGRDERQGGAGSPVSER